MSCYMCSISIKGGQAENLAHHSTNLGTMIMLQACLVGSQLSSLSLQFSPGVFCAAQMGDVNSNLRAGRAAAAASSACVQFSILP